MYKKPATPRTVTVASGQTESDAFYIGDYTVAAVRTPSALSSTAVTFTAALSEDGTYLPVVDSDGNDVSLVVQTSTAEHIALTGAELDAFASCLWCKLVCGTAEGAARTFEVVLK